MKKLFLFLIIVVLIAPASLWAVVPDYAGDVANKNANASPAGPGGVADPQFTKGETNSRVDDYIYQDDQVNIGPGDGTVKVLRTNEKINVNNFVTELIPLKNVLPRELRPAFRTVTRKEGGNADTLVDKNKKEAFMQVVCPEFQLPYLKDAAKALDEAWIQNINDGSSNFYYQAKFRPIRDVITAIFVYRSPEGYNEFDDANNAVLYNDSPGTIKLIQTGLERGDIPVNQVSLDVTIYEVDMSNDVKIGLDWIAWKNMQSNLFQFIMGRQYNFESWDRINANDSSANHNEWTRTHEFRYTGIEAVFTTEFIDLLQSKGKAKVMTKGTILTKSGNPAELASVDQTLSFKIAGTNIADTDDTANNPDVPQAKKAGSSAQIVPPQDVDDDDDLDIDYFNGVFNNYPQKFDRTINSTVNGKVGTFIYALPYVGLESMELFTSIHLSSITGLKSDGLPVIAQRNMNATVRLKDGEPFVIAGLKKSNKTESSNKMPFFGSIPVLGYAFGGENNSNQEKEIIVVITPKFILGAESDLAMPKEAKTVVAQAEGKAYYELPKTGLGYDQWLLDRED